MNLGLSSVGFVVMLVGAVMFLIGRRHRRRETNLNVVSGFGIVLFLLGVATLGLGFIGR